MMNRLNSTGARVNIVDLKDEQGYALRTKVELIILWKRSVLLQDG
jgi:hypothetical protein